MHGVNKNVKKGANVDAQDSAGNAALHFAAKRGGPQLVDFLLSKGASVDAQNLQGDTPLHLACVASASKISGGQCVKLLLDAGANRDLENKNGKKPFAVVEDLCKNYTLNEAQKTTLKVVNKRLITTKST